MLQCKGEDCTRIAGRTGFCGQCAHRMRQRINPAHSKPRGGHAALTAEQVEFIHRKHRELWSSKRIAKELGISPRTVYERLRKK